VQYILTEEEWNALVSKDDYEALKQAHKILWLHYCSVTNPSCEGSEMGDCRCDFCPISSLSLAGMTRAAKEAGIEPLEPLSHDLARLVCPRKHQHYSK